MKTVSRHVVQHAHLLAREIEARAVLVLADAIEGDDELRQLVRTVNFRTTLISRSPEAPPSAKLPHCEWVSVPDVHMTRTGQVKVALLVCLAKGLIQRGDRVVCLTGIDGSNVIDTMLVLNLGSEPELFSAADAVALGGDVAPEVFERTLSLATQLATEGREGRPVGTIFVIGDSQKVLAQSHPLVLNPFYGYPETDCNILDPIVEETIKEFSAIDGAFIVRGDGVVLAAGIQLVPTAPAPQLPKGLGTRHSAAAAITASTDAVAISVSQSTGTITVFKSGQMITDIHKPANGGRLAL
ncbi:MAG: DNA integrity scanning protein DisA nucleotide-binding domain protein [Planctomycetes bacterium]|nr:DNA integrity scanning protein DisA nucleotide-binding domain protein [Planctomycetota bacterium]